MKVRLFILLTLLARTGFGSSIDSLFVAFVQASHPSTEAETALALGKALADEGAIDSSFYYFRYVQQLPAATVGLELHAKAAYNQGYYQKQLKLHDEAIASFLIATKRYGELSNESMIAKAHWAMGECYALLGSMDKAQEHYQQAQGIFLQHGFPAEAYVFYQNVGHAHWKAGEYAEARYFFGEALQHNPGDTLRLSQVHNLLGMVYYMEGGYAQAGRHLATALAQAQPGQDIASYAWPLHNLGLLQLQAEGLDSARGLFEEAMQMVKPFGHSTIAANAKLNLSRLYLQQRDIPRALAYAHEAIALGATLPDPTLHIAALQHGIDICWLTRDNGQYQAWKGQLLGLFVTEDELQKATRLWQVANKLDTIAWEQRLAEETEGRANANSFSWWVGSVSLILLALLGGLYYRSWHSQRQQVHTLSTQLSTQGQAMAELQRELSEDRARLAAIEARYEAGQKYYNEKVKPNRERRRSS